MLPYWQHADHTATQVSLPGSDWQAGALTWDSRPAASSELGTLVSRSGEWAELDVTSHLSAVYAGERADNGYLLHANELGQRGWKRIVASSGDPLAAEPRLVVSWRAPRPTPDADPAASGVVIWANPSIAQPQRRFEVQLTGLSGGTSVSSGVVKGPAGRDTAWQVPDGVLAGGEPYSWQVRVRYGRDGAWSEWSAPAAFSYSEEPDPLGDEQRPKDHEGHRGQ
jgi:hypothetical protein